MSKVLGGTDKLLTIPPVKIRCQKHWVFLCPQGIRFPGPGVFSFGEGRLKLGNGIITDGTVFYRTLSPYLLHRLSVNHKKDNSVYGKWLSTGSLIIYFRKEVLNGRAASLS